MAVLDARRASRFAGAASQAAVEMGPCFFRNRLAFQYLLDQVNTAARAVEFIAQNLVGRASCRAKSAVHALAENVLGDLASMGGAQFVCQLILYYQFVVQTLNLQLTE